MMLRYMTRRSLTLFALTVAALFVSAAGSRAHQELEVFPANDPEDGNARTVAELVRRIRAGTAERQPAKS